MNGAGGPSLEGPAPRSPNDTPGGGGMSSVLSHRVMDGRACVTPCLGDVAGTAGAATAASSEGPVTACRASDPLPTEDTVLSRAGLGAGALAAGCTSRLCSCAVSAGASAARRRAAAAETAASWRFRHASSSWLGRHGRRSLVVGASR